MATTFLVDNNGLSKTNQGKIEPSFYPMGLGFWLVVVLFLLLIWGFAFLPTQDGPCHLANALILKNYNTPDKRFQKFFEIRQEPLPNWASQLILVLLLYGFPPLISEKVFVSGHIIFFIVAFRFFAQSVHRDSPITYIFALVFVFNHCFWMGFYNYILSLDLYFLCLGLFLRHWNRLNWAFAGLLSVVFLLTFFSHLLGFLLSAGSVVLLAATRPPLVRNVFYCCLATVPAGALAMKYFFTTDFFDSPASHRFAWSFLHPVGNGEILEKVEENILFIDKQLFGPLADESFFLVFFTLCFFLFLLGTALWRGATVPDSKPQFSPIGRLWLLVVGLCLLYLFIPDHLGDGHGGFLKLRFAPLFPLFMVVLFAEPKSHHLRLIYWALAGLLIFTQFVCVWTYLQNANRALASYTCGVSIVTNQRVIYPIQPKKSQRLLSDPLLHAADYYALTGGNINLDNYQALTRHFPIKFKDQGASSLLPFADTIIIWDQPANRYDHILRGFQPCLLTKRLAIYKK